LLLSLKVLYYDIPERTIALVKVMSPGFIRKPAVAGMFYPSDASELRKEVRAYIHHGRRSESQTKPKAIIGPHAGYVYSGPIAGSAYACLAPLGKIIKNVILLGPSHRITFRGIASSSATHFHTPLGDVPVDHHALNKINDLPFVVQNDLAHLDEHGLEVHLPFLQETLESFSIVPLVVGDSTGEEVARIIHRLWGGAETLIVVSSDLSHYLKYEEARRIDQLTSEAIEKLNPDEIEFTQACGRLPVQGLLMEAAKHHLTATTVDLRNSGDTAGDKRQVVGYGAYVFTP